MTVAENWHAHDYEPWAAAWNYWDTNVLFSGSLTNAIATRIYAEMIPLIGGDDLKMKGWDVRQGFDCPIFENRR
jgi:diphthamide biosynthesis protein 7